MTSRLAVLALILPGVIAALGSGGVARANWLTALTKGVTKAGKEATHLHPHLGDLGKAAGHYFAVRRQGGSVDSEALRRVYAEALATGANILKSAPSPATPLSFTPGPSPEGRGEKKGEGSERSP